MKEKKNNTLVFLVDESGSMFSIKSAMEEAFNNFILEQKQSHPDTEVSIYGFNSDRFTVVSHNKNIKELGKFTIEPSGLTPLYDSIGRAINKHIGSNTLTFVVITDGHENNSREFTSEAISYLIKKQKENNWQFVVLGTTEDAMLDFGKCGIQRTNYQYYVPNEDGVHYAFTCLSKSYERHIASGSQASDNFWK